MFIIQRANAQRFSIGNDHLRSRNRGWLVEGLLPLGSVEWVLSDDDDANFFLLELGLEVAHPVDARPHWRGCYVRTHGAAVLLFGAEDVQGVVGRQIVLDPRRPKHIVSEANHKLFRYSVRRGYELTQAGEEFQKLVLTTKDLKLIVISLLWPFLPNGFERPGHSRDAGAWLEQMARKTGAAVLVRLSGHSQIKSMLQGNIRLAVESCATRAGVK